MTKKITISVPDDIAAHLEGVSNVSAYISEAVRRRVDADRTRQMLISAGFAITDEGIAAARERRTAALANIDDSLRERAEALYAEVTGGRA